MPPHRFARTLLCVLAKISMVSYSHNTCIGDTYLLLVSLEVPALFLRWLPVEQGEWSPLLGLDQRADLQVEEGNRPRSE